MTIKLRKTKDINEVKLRTTHLENLKNKNLDTSHTKHKIHHPLCKPEIYINSYGNISKNKSSQTVGVKKDEEYIGKFELSKAQTLATQRKSNTIGVRPEKHSSRNLKTKKCVQLINQLRRTELFKK
jgi:hypothetical protein